MSINLMGCLEAFYLAFFLNFVLQSIWFTRDWQTKYKIDKEKCFFSDSFYFFFSEEKQEIRKAILNCSLTRGNKEAFQDESESEEDEEE